jgi:hypothetical protein
MKYCFLRKTDAFIAVIASIQTLFCVSSGALETLHLIETQVAGAEKGDFYRQVNWPGFF